MPDGARAYTRSGEFNLRADRTLVTGAGQEVLSDGGGPIVGAVIRWKVLVFGVLRASRVPPTQAQYAGREAS